LFLQIEKHFSKQGVYAVQELPIFPDFNVSQKRVKTNVWLIRFEFQLWAHSCAQVIFDTDPSPKVTNDRSSSLSQVEEMSQAMIRGMADESGEQFVAYFIPTEEAMEKRKRDELNGVEYEEDEE
jgi:RNA polymerase II-associated factor 1